ncbi:MAG TPA: MFS transporter [Firmicutes bacterium]|nr:MFS transporter [Candidatus Fermentithermobacillaceae bacterium]
MRHSKNIEASSSGRIGLSQVSAPSKVRAGLSALYFLTYLGLGVYWTYGNVYFRDIGVSVAEIGMLNALYFGVAIFGHPFFGYIYDKLPRKYITIGATAILAALTGFMVPAQNSAIGRAVIYALFSLFSSALMPLMDAGALMWCSKHDVPFQAVRIWGTIGYLFSSVLGGMILESVDLAWSYYVTGIVLSVVSTLVLAFNKAGCLPYNSASGTLSKPMNLNDVKTVVTSKAFLQLLIIAFLFRIAFTGPLSLYTVYLDHRGYSASQIGYIMIVGGLSEIIILLGKKEFLDRIPGDWLLTMAVVLSGVRWLLAINIQSYLGLLTLQLISGTNFILFYMVAVEKTNRLFPEQLSGVGQTVFGSVFYGLGPVIGSLLAGLMVENAGYEKSFCIFAVMCLCVGFVQALLSRKPKIQD